MYRTISKLINASVYYDGKEIHKTIKEETKMSKAEIEVKIAEWERKQFLNAMNDHWSDADYKFDRECEEQIKALKKMLEEVNE